MKRLSHIAFFVAMATWLFISTLQAEERGRLIFEDNFNRNELQEDKEEVGNGWSTNSASRAGGHKQADLRDGTLHIYIHKTADHAVSVRHDAEFKDGSVELRFMLENSKDVLGLNFADLQLKSVWAGHLFKVDIGTSKLDITDLKTGNMDLQIRAKRMADKNDPELAQLLRTKRTSIPVKLETGKWYTLNVTVSGDSIRVDIDGKETGAFKSEGFAHPTKRMLRLSVPREAVVDDLKIFAAAK